MKITREELEKGYVKRMKITIVIILSMFVYSIFKYLIL